MPLTYIYDREPKSSRCYYNVKKETRFFGAKTTGFVDDDFKKNTGAAAKKIRRRTQTTKNRIHARHCSTVQNPGGRYPGTGHAAG